MACDNKTKTEAGQSVGAMQPVVGADEVLSKQDTLGAIDDAFGALQLGTDPIEDEEVFEERGDYITLTIPEWCNLIGTYGIYKVWRWFDIKDDLNLCKRYWNKTGAKFIDPDLMNVQTYRAKSAFGKSDLDQLKGKNVTDKTLAGLRDHDLLNAVHVYSYNGKKIFGYASATFTKIPGGLKNFYFKLYDGSMAEYEFWYLAWSANRMRIGIRKIQQQLAKVADHYREAMAHYNESGDIIQRDPIAEAMRSVGIGLDLYMESSENGQDRVYVDDSYEEVFEEAGTKIDDDIRPIINKLNQKGYKTRYSCSGHPSARMKNDNLRDGVRYGKLYSTARIVFDKIYDLPSIPDEWSKKVLNKGEEDEAVAIYVKPPRFHIIDGLPEKQYANWKKRYMSKLEKWADELPAAGKVKDDENSEVSLESVLEEIAGEVMLG